MTFGRQVNLVFSFTNENIYRHLIVSSIPKFRVLGFSFQKNDNLGELCKYFIMLTTLSLFKSSFKSSFTVNTYFIAHSLETMLMNTIQWIVKLIHYELGDIDLLGHSTGKREVNGEGLNELLGSYLFCRFPFKLLNEWTMGANSHSSLYKQKT